MSYSAFLSVMSQLTQGRKACVTVDSKEIWIEKLAEGEEWVFSTRLNNLDEEDYSCFSSTGSFRLQQGPVFLQLEASCVRVVQHVRMPSKKYLPFKHHLKAFLDHVIEYEEIFNDSSLERSLH